MDHGQCHIIGPCFAYISHLPAEPEPRKRISKNWEEDESMDCVMLWYAKQ